MAFAQSKQARADRRENRDSSGRYVRFRRVDEPDRAFGTARLIPELDGRMHRDDVGGYMRWAMDCGAGNFTQQQFADLRHGFGHAQCKIGQIVGFGADEMDGGAPRSGAFCHGAAGFREGTIARLHEGTSHSFDVPRVRSIAHRTRG
uniref:Uncharacterized protein n=1 Tax=Sphingobium baderi TaxID=1332080 RepID=X5CFG8_9SPHN|nr:hypothetical protein [Sphingobium baderi]